MNKQKDSLTGAAEMKFLSALGDYNRIDHIGKQTRQKLNIFEMLDKIV
jgi:hypothetical protein